jgi:hypothetical protein
LCGTRRGGTNALIAKVICDVSLIMLLVQVMLRIAHFVKRKYMEAEGINLTETMSVGQVSIRSK